MNGLTVAPCEFVHTRIRNHPNKVVSTEMQNFAKNMKKLSMPFTKANFALFFKISKNECKAEGQKLSPLIAI
jgi:hypothetical protein